MINHTGTVKITSENIILRRFVMEDSFQMFNAWASLDIVTKNLQWTPHKNIDKTRFVINTWINYYKKYNYYNWCIEDKITEEVMGCISLSNFDDENKSCEVGYCLGYKFWNKGIMTEALNTVCSYAFNIINVSCIYSKCYEENIPSCRVLKKAGFAYNKIKFDKTENKSIKEFIKLKDV